MQPKNLTTDRAEQQPFWARDFHWTKAQSKMAPLSRNWSEENVNARGRCTRQGSPRATRGPNSRALGHPMSAVVRLHPGFPPLPMHMRLMRAAGCQLRRRSRPLLSRNWRKDSVIGFVIYPCDLESFLPPRTGAVQSYAFIPLLAALPFTEPRSVAAGTKRHAFPSHHAAMPISHMA